MFSFFKSKEPSTENFPVEELRCKCAECKGERPNEVNADALRALQAVRTRYGKPMKLTSAYRCAKHPVEAVKAKPGTHHEGIAFDIAVPWGRDRMKLIKLALAEGFQGFGFANGFLHIDYRTDPLTSWDYK